MLANLIGLRVTLTTTGVLVGCGLCCARLRRLIVAGVAITGFGLLMTVVQDNWTIPLAGGLKWGWFSLLGFIRTAVGAILVIALALLGAGLLSYFWSAWSPRPPCSR